MGQPAENIRNKICGRTVGHLLDAISQAMLDETFDERDDRALAWDKKAIDEKGWQDIAAIFRDAIYQTMRAVEEAENRLKANGGEPILASWAFLFFKSPFVEPDTGESPA